jgi:hypothetical protein
MADVTALQAQLETLRAAYRSGVLRVHSGDKDVQYRSSAEMREAIASLENEIAAATGSTVRSVLVRSTKGW